MVIQRNPIQNKYTLKRNLPIFPNPTKKRISEARSMSSEDLRSAHAIGVTCCLQDLRSARHAVSMTERKKSKGYS